MSITKTCEFCDYDFTVPPSRSDSSYCSRECYSASQRKRVKIECENCGDTFDVIPSDKNRRRYCSKDCQYENMSGGSIDTKEGVQKKCNFCGDVFETKESLSDQQFCSRECFYEHRRQRETVTCDSCGGTFERIPSAVREHNYCSWDCYDEQRPENLHPLKNSDAMKAWSREVKRRDGYECQECGTTGARLNSHHITPVKEDRDKALDIDNGITLCLKCHSKKHPQIANLILSQS